MDGQRAVVDAVILTEPETAMDGQTAVLDTASPGTETPMDGWTARWKGLNPSSSLQRKEEAVLRRVTEKLEDQNRQLQAQLEEERCNLEQMEADLEREEQLIREMVLELEELESDRCPVCHELVPQAEIEQHMEAACIV